MGGLQWTVGWPAGVAERKEEGRGRRGGTHGRREDGLGTRLTRSSAVKCLQWQLVSISTAAQISSELKISAHSWAAPGDRAQKGHR